VVMIAFFAGISLLCIFICKIGAIVNLFNINQ
jgi:hypothetical protein